ncbi:MAG: NADH-quinone oxidoreductase subunit L [Bacteroidota bacterium]
MNYSNFISFILLLPLAGFVCLGLGGKNVFRKSAGAIGCFFSLITAVLALVVASRYFFGDRKVDGVYHSIIAFRYTWLPFASGLSIDMGALLDPISVMMLVVVSFVSLMVFIFSLGYMKGEDRYSTYYAFLSLFTFSMLGLVISSNIFQIYIFWELVGVSSYLLIGFYFDKPAAVAASKKAFIVTRFADLGFLVGILMLAFQSGTLDFGLLLERLSDPDSPQFLGSTASSFFGVSLLTWALVLVFNGGAGKSAMFPLHIWLPDAMEGPTPVSALIHAATMVVAGVYLVARLFPLFSLDTAVLSIITWVGALSAILAAIIACTQTDIKRVLAYSTMSQIGYMMLALGVARYGGEAGAGYTASLFHLFTHAFFKSLLFLCAGTIIHFVHSNELKDMGGLRKLLPVTHISFLIACLAIAGIPPFSGFFSKEEILAAAWKSDKLVYGVGLVTAAITAFYMFRLYFSIFWNKEGAPSASLHGLPASHGSPEGPFSMRVPLMILSIGALLAGFIPFSHYVTSDGKPLEETLSISFSIVPVVLAVGGIWLAYSLYSRESDRPGKIAVSLGALYKTAYKKFYIDDIYLFITKKIIFNGIGRPAAWIDKHIIDGMMNAVAALVGKVAIFIKGIQSGKVQNYALYFFGGVIGLAILFIYLRNS